MVDMQCLAAAHSSSSEQSIFMDKKCKGHLNIGSTTSYLEVANPFLLTSQI